MKIFKQISLVMADIEAIGKNRRNQQQGFMFRGIDDIYNELHSHLAKHGVFTVPEVLDMVREDRQTKAGGSATCVILKIKYTFFADDGSNVSAIMVGEAVDSGDKASNKAQAIAHKYALLQVFAIPTLEDKDPDADTHDLGPKHWPKKPQDVKPATTPSQSTGPKKMETAADYQIQFGKSKGKTLGEMGAMWVSDSMSFIKTKASPKFSQSQSAKEFLFWAEQYLKKNPIDDLDKALGKNEPAPGDLAPPPDWANEPMPEF
jgi:hypothetical protein